MSQREEVGAIKSEDEAVQQLEILRAERQEWCDKIQSKDESIRELKSMVSQLEAIQDSLATRNANLQEEKEELTGKLSTATVDLSKQKEEKVCLESKLLDLEIVRTQLNLEIASKVYTLERLNSEYDENERKLKTVETELAKVCYQLRNLSDVQLPEKAIQVKALEKKCDELSAEKAVMEVTLKATSDNISKLADDKEKLVREAEENSVRMEELETEKAAVEKRLCELEVANEAAQRRMVDLEAERAAAEKAACNLRKELTGKFTFSRVFFL
jgi:chromosome segregation ATPase